MLLTGNQIFVKRLQYISIENTLHKQSENAIAVCASKSDVSELSTTWYTFNVLVDHRDPPRPWTL